MKNLMQNVSMKRVAKESTATQSNKGFYYESSIYQKKDSSEMKFIILGFMCLVLFLMCCFNVATAQLIKGGETSLDNGPLTNIKVKTLNLTGENLCDFWLKFNGNTKVKTITVNGAVIKPKSKVNNIEHVILPNCIENGSQVIFNITFSGNITNLVLIPTDSMHSDLLINVPINPNVADTIVVVKKTTVPGGTQSPVFPASKFPSLGFTNKTGTDICDLSIESTSEIDCVFVNNQRVDSTYAKGKKVADGKSANSKIVHVYFPCVKDGDSYKVTVKLKGEITTYTVTPTDSMHADVMSNENVNPGGVPQGKPARVTPTSGGKQTTKFSPSSFPRLPFINETGTAVCDMTIELPSSIKIENIFVNDKAVDSIKVGNIKKTPPVYAKSVHVYFPCIPNGDKYTVSIKIKDEIKTYSYVPTDSLNADIVTGIQNIHPGDSPSRKITFPESTSSNRPSTVFVNDTRDSIEDLEISTKYPIDSIKVNGVIWNTNPPFQKNDTIHVYAIPGAGIAPGQQLVITIYLANGKTITNYTVTFTNPAHDQIYVCSFTGGMNTLLMPNENAPFGLSGRSGSLTTINESCAPISQLIFSSPDSGISIIDASSTLLYTFDNLAQTLYFIDPIMLGELFNFRFTINWLLPYSPTDTFPYTSINVNIPGVSTPFDGYGTITPSSVPSASDGSIDFSMTAGLPVFNYLWSNGTTDEDLTNIMSGTYTLTVTSPNGCMQKIFEVPFETPEIPVIPHFEIIPINVWCTGANNGSAFIQTSVDYPLTYVWSNGATTAINEQLAPGNYTCSVFDFNNLVWSGTVSITEPLPVSVTGVVTKLSCNGNLSGAIDITPFGGNPSYQFLWNNGKTTQNRTALRAGTYTVTVSDGFGCSASTSFKVKQPAKLTLTTTTTDVQCNGGNNGAAIATATGGTKPYSFQWSNGVIGNTATGLAAGTYNVILNDAQGCNMDASANINQPPPMLINVFPIGQSQAFAQVIGGFPPYNFQWNTIPVQTTQIAQGLLPNQTYIVTVTDSHGCLQTISFILPSTRISSNAAAFEIKALPNPTTGMLQLTSVNKGAETFSIQLYDQTGRIIYESPASLRHDSMDLSNYENGIYWLKASSINHTSVIKVVLQKN